MRKLTATAAALLLGLGAATRSRAADPPPKFLSWAPTPPMGWNSRDCFGTAVTEAQVRANADYMAEKLRPQGWEYVVVDIQWYEPRAHGNGYRKGAELDMDDH